MIVNRAKLTFLFLAWLITASCSAQQGAPEDKMIKGPFRITSEWKTFELSNPLKTMPHIQTFNILLKMDEYIYDPSVDTGKDKIISGSYRRLSDSKTLLPEVIFIDNAGREFKATYKSIGTSITSEGEYNSLGFGNNSDLDKFFYPKDAEFRAVKLKSNTPFIAEHFWWVAYRYERAPNRKWTDIDPSEIVQPNK